MRDAAKTPEVVVALSQVYPPGPTSLGQHLADATSELATRGHEVIVYTANRDYADPSVRFRDRETLRGVDVCRLRLSSFGKRSMAARLAGGLAFLVQAVFRALLLPRVDIVLVSTSPPMAGFAGAALALLRGARLVWWVMDLNPDQAVAQGIAKPGSWVVRVYDWMNRTVLRRADAVIAMDRFMADRLNRKHPIGRRMHVIPPWPHAGEETTAGRFGKAFRREHGIDDKFVVMYSGNHAAANPLRTVIEAAVAMQQDPGFAFVFIGSGTGKKDVEDARASNILSLPYQPFETLPESLGAADLHVVTMGDDMIGIVHPCKIYGAIAASRPILFIGPDECHVTDLLSRASIGWHIGHGDVDGAVDAIRQASALTREALDEMGLRAALLASDQFSRARLCAQFCDVVEAAAVPLRQETVPHGYADANNHFELS